MYRRIIRSTTLFTLFLLALVSATTALAQSALPEGPATSSTWQSAQSAGSSMGKLFVVTLDQPRRRQTCRVRLFTLDKLVCSRSIGGPRTYVPQQVLALILPGDHGLKLRIVLALNAALGTAIWGTVVFAATCPACAVATGIAAFLLFAAAGAILIGDEQPDRLLYLAPGQQLTSKLRFNQP